MRLADALGSPVVHLAGEPPPEDAESCQPPVDQTRWQERGTHFPGPPHRRVLGVKPVSRPAGPTPGPNPTAHLVGVVEDPWRLLARVSARPSRVPWRPRCCPTAVASRPRPRPSWSRLRSLGHRRRARRPCPPRPRRAHLALGARRVLLPGGVAQPRAARPARSSRRRKRLRASATSPAARRPNSGFDCSGYTATCSPGSASRIPRVSRDQYALGDQARRSQAVPGDLVFFHSQWPGLPRGDLRRRQPRVALALPGQARHARADLGLVGLLRAASASADTSGTHGHAGGPGR